MAAVFAPSAPPTDLEALKSGVMDTFPVQESVGPKRIALKVSECPVEEVTVFTDRAEVTRAVSVVAPSIGQYDVIIEGVTKLAVADSFRRVLSSTFHGMQVITHLHTRWLTFMQGERYWSLSHPGSVVS